MNLFKNGSFNSKNCSFKFLAIVAVAMVIGCNQAAGPGDIEGVEDLTLRPPEGLKISPIGEFSSKSLKGKEYSQDFKVTFNKNPETVQRSATSGWLGVKKKTHNVVSVFGKCNETGESYTKLKVWTSRGTANVDIEITCVENN